mgnify:CR=1 FL=1
MSEDIYQFAAKNIAGEETNLNDYKGKVVLIVNTASDCGFTPQYRELQELYETYKDSLVVIGVPCNQFGNQEPWENDKIKEFINNGWPELYKNINNNNNIYLFNKIDVNGDNTDKVYLYLKHLEHT